jgi:hypothetical protein
MKTVSDYKIVTSSPENIGNKVMEFLDIGYELHEGPFHIALDNGGWVIGQAVIQYNETFGGDERFGRH